MFSNFGSKNKSSISNSRARHCYVIYICLHGMSEIRIDFDSEPVVSVDLIYLRFFRDENYLVDSVDLSDLIASSVRFDRFHMTPENIINAQKKSKIYVLRAP